MKKKYWLAGSLLALVCAIYFSTGGDRSPTVPAQQESAADSPAQANSGNSDLHRAEPYPPARSRQAPAAGNTAQLSSARPPIPAPGSEPDKSPPARVQLWQTPEADASVSIDGVPGVRLQVNPEHLQQLRLGQTLVFDIPDSSTVLETELSDTYNDPGGVQVWQGHIDGDVDEAAVIISRGKSHTHLIIASAQGNYSVVIDNQSGESTFINEGDIHEGQAPVDDGIYVGPPDSIPLPSIQ